MLRRSVFVSTLVCIVMDMSRNDLVNARHLTLVSIPAIAPLNIVANALVTLLLPSVLEEDAYAAKPSMVARAIV